MAEFHTSTDSTPPSTQPLPSRGEESIAHCGVACESVIVCVTVVCGSRIMSAVIDMILSFEYGRNCNVVVVVITSARGTVIAAEVAVNNLCSAV